VVLANDEQLLARRSVVTRTDVLKASVYNIEAVDNGKANRFGTLYDATTHFKA
jgi:hypothetical protein